MHLCPHCAYINGFSDCKPNINCYISDSDSEENNNDEYLSHNIMSVEKGGALISVSETNEHFILTLTPTIFSQLFDKVFEISNYDVMERFKLLLNKKMCDFCLQRLYANKDCHVVSELSEHEKLFRKFMRSQY